MTEKEKRVIEKLQALIKDTPYEGEKQTALNVLKNYCLKHNIDEKELETDAKQVFEYKVNGSPEDKSITDYDLFSVIARHFFERQEKDFYEMGFRYIKKGKSIIMSMELTPNDFVNLISEYEFYLKAYKREQRKALKDFQFKFFRAFLRRQGLLFPSDPEDCDKQPTDEEIERELEVIKQSERIKKVQYFKQIK